MAVKACKLPKLGRSTLVIMDVGLPDIDGREAARILRKNGFKAPIIMLTGHDTDSDTILGLESRRGLSNNIDGEAAESARN
jgi:DNA-binding response OmpR family regulator